MRLDALLLADAVSAPPDGKFYIHGGGFTRFTVPVLPFTTQLGVFIRLELDEADITKQHLFKFSMTDPEEAFVLLPQELAGGPFEEGALAREALVEGEERYLALALMFGGVTFGRAGLHRFHFYLGEKLMRSVPLPVVALTAEQLHRPPVP